MKLHQQRMLRRQAMDDFKFNLKRWQLDIGDADVRVEDSGAVILCGVELIPGYTAGIVRTILEGRRVRKDS